MVVLSPSHFYSMYLQQFLALILCPKTFLYIYQRSDVVNHFYGKHLLIYLFQDGILQNLSTH